MTEQQRCILTIHAHPDDEASKGAPTLAMYKAQGVRTILVCCTGGEEGDLQNPAMRAEGQPFFGLTPEEEKALMADLRTSELAESAEIIGFDEVVMLGYRDSGMVDTEPNNHPDSFHMASMDEAVGRLVEVIRRTKPQVIITYNDDQAGYPHPDHVKVHDISIPAFERAGDPAWYPDLGKPFQPSKMYYTMWTRARLMAVHEAMLRLRGSSPYDEKWLARPSSDERITTRLDVGGYLWARSGALRAHATQVDPAEPFWFGLDDDELAEAYPYEDWVLAHSHVGFVPAGEVETDLFDRIDVATEPLTADAAAGGVSLTESPVRVQYRVAFGKKDEAVEGPDDADIVVTVAAEDATLDPAVAFMRGKLKATGSTGALFDLFKSGEIPPVLARLAARP